MRKMKFLWGALCVLAAAAVALEATRTAAPAEDYGEKLEASALAVRCAQAVRELKEELGVPLNEGSDINATGLIGADYSPITTTLGALEAKRTSTNPNMAAVVVDMFHELGLEAGDRIAVNCSGSFPALNIAVLCAAEVLELDPVMISSFGSSTHGANDPACTYLDMEHRLYEEGLLRNRSGYFSVGGMEDLGLEMEEKVRAEIVERLEGFGYVFLEGGGLLENIAARYELYRSFGEIKCFLNVGGNDVSFGDSQIIVHADGGILTRLPENDRSTGLVQLFLRDGVPVIHLLNINSLATRYGLPIDPAPLPEAGEGGVYFVETYRKGVAAAGLALAGYLLWRGRSARFFKNSP